MLKQSLQQKLQQKLSPQQIQLMKLLQVPTLELEARIKEELEANPALEEGREEEQQVDSADGLDDDRGETREDFDFDAYLDDPTPGYRYAVNNHAEHEDRDTAFGAGETFSDRLAAQVGLQPVTDRQRMLAAFLIGNLDEAGYLRRDLYAISSDLAFGQGVEVAEEELEDILAIVQRLDPAGVGARDLRECLVLQLERKLELAGADGREGLALAKRILDEQFDAFTKKHYDKLVARLDVGEDALRSAMAEITRLNPKPGNSGADNARPIQAVVPDFHVAVEGDELRLQINGRNAPELKVSNEYRDMMQGYAASKSPDRTQKEAITFVKRKVDAAKWFIDAIKQRQNTLRVTMQAILQLQEAYFLTGDETQLQPHDPQRHRGTHQHGHQHRVTGGQFQICPNPLRHLFAEIAVQRIPHHRERGGGVYTGGQKNLGRSR